MQLYTLKELSENSIFNIRQLKYAIESRELIPYKHEKGKLYKVSQTQWDNFIHNKAGRGYLEAKQDNRKGLLDKVKKEVHGK